MTEDEMVGWHHRLSGSEFEQALGDGEGQGGQVCYSAWGRKESGMTERLNNAKGGSIEEQKNKKDTIHVDIKQQMANLNPTLQLKIQ